MTQDQNTNTGDAPTRDMPPPDHTVILEVPRDLGTYRLTKILGRGGMGEVWQAFDKSLERDVAIKLMRKELTSNEDATRRFAREARAVARLNHPNIVQVYAFGDEKGLNYFVMELVEGETVSQRLKKNKKINLEDALHIILQAVEGLSYANARGIIHRDIKPSNLMLISDDQRVKIADFGLAKMVEHDTQMTAAGTAMGSPNYMSPEQARGEEADHRSDIYALGVSLYQMLCGDLPFTASSPVSVLLKQIQDPLPEHDLITCLSDGNVFQVLRKMTEKNPSERYQNYGELANDLAALQPNVKFRGAHLPTSSMPAATPVSGSQVDDSIRSQSSQESLQISTPASPDNGTAVISSRNLKTPTPSPSSAGAKSIKPLLIALAITLLLGLIGFLSWLTLGYKDRTEIANQPTTTPTPVATPETIPQPTATPIPSTPSPTPEMQPVDITVIATPPATPIPGMPLTVTPTPTLAELAPSSGRLILVSPDGNDTTPVPIYDSEGNIAAQATAGTAALLIRPLTIRGEKWLAIRYNNNEAYIPEASAKQDTSSLLAPAPSPNVTMPASKNYILGLPGSSPTQTVPVYIDDKARTEYKQLPAGTELILISEGQTTFKVNIPGESRPVYVLKKLAHVKP